VGVVRTAAPHSLQPSRPASSPAGEGSSKTAQALRSANRTNKSTVPDERRATATRLLRPYLRSFPLTPYLVVEVLLILVGFPVPVPGGGSLPASSIVYTG